MEAAARRPYVYDPDCPLLTEAQLAEFRPIHSATIEERAEAMRKAGIVDPAKPLAHGEFLHLAGGCRHPSPALDGSRIAGEVRKWKVWGLGYRVGIITPSCRLLTYPSIFYFPPVSG